MENVRFFLAPPFSLFAFPLLINILPLRFFKDIFGIDPDSIWLGLCRNETEAKNHCRVFLEDYVEFSERPVLCPGLEETKLERSVKAAYTVRSLWKTFVLAANNNVLRDKKRDELSQASLWTLQFSDGDRGSGPVWEIFLRALSPFLFVCPFFIL